MFVAASYTLASLRRNTNYNHRCVASQTICGAECQMLIVMLLNQSFALTSIPMKQV